ncbi:MAG: ABC transporter ATP-binding protein [Bifidobacteriaceae bacterium]|nr:ABC transporter ATP-binding protein [Bifidobacteriaceae bacterium]
MNYLLEIAHLAKDYQAPALRDVSFVLPAGHIMGLAGPNGSGKTTTIKTILGLARKKSGTVRVFGRSVDGADSQTAGRIAVVMDQPFLVEDWTVAVAGRTLAPFYPSWDWALHSAYLSRFRLDPAKRVKELSRGMKVKLQLAFALSQGADLLILDEPTAGLDPLARDEVRELLLEFVADEAKGVLFSTHTTADLEAIADFITLIQAGRTVFTGPKDELLTRYARVAGGPRDLDPAAEGLVIGCRRHQTGFEGLVEATQSAHLPRQVLRERASLDEILVFLNRGDEPK